MEGADTRDIEKGRWGESEQVNVGVSHSGGGGGCEWGGGGRRH